MRPRVSVIMPAFNSEAVLPSAIESVLAQTEERLELIVIDDASSDRTYAIALEYAALDRRVRVHRSEYNSRAGPIEWEPRNDGLRLARGEFVAYLDADNTWRLDFLTRLVGEMLRSPELQLVYCDSRNHYSETDTERVVRYDRRRLVQRGPTWTVFSNERLDPARLGVDQYIDTNELVHRAGVFARLGGLWRTAHPCRGEVSRNVHSLRADRRHNDLDLVQRIVEAFGIEAVGHVPEVLVDYFYPSAQRSLRPAPSLLRPPTALHPQAAHGHASIAADRAHGLLTSSAGARYDLGPGEIRAPGLALTERYSEFTATGGMHDRLLIYRGSETVTGVMDALAAHFGGLMPGIGVGPEHLVCFDGCHEAIGGAVGTFTGTLDNRFGRDAVAFPVPSYPYWTIATAGRHRAVGLEAHSAEEHLDALRSLRRSDIGAVILNSPNNPLGYTYDVETTAEISRLARERGWGIVADITCSCFLDQGALAAIAGLAPERTVICDSVSKAWGMPGLRLGFAVAPDAGVASALRAYKSARTLLPSSLKLAFFGHLLADAADIPQRIVAIVNQRRTRLRAALGPLDGDEIELPPVAGPGLYEVVMVDRACHATGMTPDDLAARLLERASVRTSPDSAFFPPGQARNPRRRFLRLSVGRCDEVEGAAKRLAEHLRVEACIKP